MIYFIQQLPNGPIKIGLGANVGKRLRTLQVGSPVRLKVIGVIDGDRQLEREIHRKFAQLRVHGEWFSSDKKLLIFVRDHTVSYEPRIHDPGPKFTQEMMDQAIANLYLPPFLRGNS